MKHKFISETEEKDIFIVQDEYENKISLNKEELFSLYCEIEDMLEEERTKGY